MIPLLVARGTFREVSRDRVLAGITLAGFALLLLTQLLSPLALGESRRLTVDLGLSAISLLGTLVILLVGTHLVAKEIERRTLYNLLTRPITRHAYLIGKWAGLSAALGVVAVLLGAGMCAILATHGDAHYIPGVLEAIYFAVLELVVVTAIAVMFSAISTPVLSSLYTLSLFMVGQWSYDLRAFAANFPPSLGMLTATVANLVPNLPLFNMRTLAANGQTTSGAHLAIATLYAATYCGCALALATAAFERRDFK